MIVEDIQNALIDLKKLKPLILCLTNYVTMDFVANCLLAIGSAPLMSNCKEELKELIQSSHAIYLNMGSLDPDFISSCDDAIKLAQQYHKPVILDPVGAGASLMRTHEARKIMPCASVIKGNASEIMALLNDEVQTKGVETLSSTEDAITSAQVLSQRTQRVFVVSGKKDFITDGKRKHFLDAGSPVMSNITGMGCALGAVISAFTGVVLDSFDAAKLATSYFGFCGTLAHLKSNRPGSFRTAFIDELYCADFNQMKKWIR